MYVLYCTVDAVKRMNKTANCNNVNIHHTNGIVYRYIPYTQDWFDRKFVFVLHESVRLHCRGCMQDFTLIAFETFSVWQRQGEWETLETRVENGLRPKRREARKLVEADTNSAARHKTTRNYTISSLERKLLLLYM